jgi:hypothetical protein
MNRFLEACGCFVLIWGGFILMFPFGLMACALLASGLSVDRFIHIYGLVMCAFMTVAQIGFLYVTVAGW